jgi:hypothetical protein
MWNLYLSNVENNGPFGDECWLGVFSDEALQWLFHPAFLTLPSPSPFDLIHFFKRWKIEVGLRRKFADSIIMNQQINCPSLSQNLHRQHMHPSNFSLLPLFLPRTITIFPFQKIQATQVTFKVLIPSPYIPPSI